MTLISLKTGFEDGVVTAKLELSDGNQYSVKTCYLYDNCQNLESWEIGKELSSAEIEALSFASSCRKIEKAATRLIARAEQRRWNLTAKLEHRGFSSACVKAVVMRLLELDLVNDLRYAELWLRGRLARRAGKITGPRELRAMLQNRGIDRETAELAFRKVLDEETELSLLERFLAKKGSIASQRWQLKAEGFSPDVLRRYFDEYNVNKI